MHWQENLLQTPSQIEELLARVKVIAVLGIKTEAQSNDHRPGVVCVPAIAEHCAAGTGGGGGSVRVDAGQDEDGPPGVAKRRTRAIKETAQKGDGSMVNFGL